MSKKSKKKNKAKIQSQPNQLVKVKSNIWLFCLIILIVGAGLYLRTAMFEYVYCDDDKFVINVYDYNKELSNIITSFQQTLTSGSAYYRPVLISSFIIDANLGGLDPAMYRVTNIILHLLGSILVFFTLLKLKYEEFPSFLLTLLFVVHPMLTPAVSWISGRNDSMITIFLLLSFIMMINFIEKKDGKKWIYYSLHLLMFLIALFTKEIAAFFPFVAYLYMLLIKKENYLSKNNIILGTGWLVTGLIWFAMRSAAMEHTNTPDTIGWDAVVLNYPSIFTYISKAIIPFRMTPLSLFETFTVLLGAAIIIAIIVYTILSKSIRKNYIIFGALWYVFFLFPTLLVRLLDDFFDYAEHRVYLLMVGIFIVIMEIIKSLKIDFKKPTVLAIASLIIAFLGVKAFIYENSFKDMFRFWGSYVRTYPDVSKGYYNLGLAYYTIDSLDKAERIYRKALKLDSSNVDLYINMAALYIKKRRFDLAEQYALMGLRYDPDNNLVNYNLGKSYYLRNQYQKAQRPFEIAVSRTPNPKWFITLGFTYYKNNNMERAIAAYKESIRLDPKDPVPWSLLGRVYYELKDFKEAERVSMRAIEINPLYKDAYINLLNIYVVQNNRQAALQVVTQMKNRNLEIPEELMLRLDQMK